MDHMTDVVLMSIEPKWAEQILEGSKKWEYKKYCSIAQGTRIIIYATKPVQALVGEFTVGERLEKPVDELITQTIHETKHTKEEILNYFNGVQIGSALRVVNPKRYKKVKLEEIRKKLPGFRPPMKYKSITADELKAILELVELNAF
jgi:predicted transcriptional regulator